MTLQQQIIKALGAKPQINAEEEIRRSIDFLKSYLQTYPFIKSLVLGISGGQDFRPTNKTARLPSPLFNRIAYYPVISRARYSPASRHCGKQALN